MQPPHPHRTDWDTPPDGDFASYVERLTRTPPAPHTVAAPPAGGRQAPRSGPGAARTASSATPAARRPQQGPQLQAFARAARAVLLAFLGLHAAVWWLFGVGSFLLLALTGGAWWLLERALQQLSGPRAAVPAAIHPVLDALREAARRQPPPPRK